MIQKTNDTRLEKILWSTSSVNWCIILLTNPVFSTQTSSFSKERWSVQHADVPTDVLESLHNLQLHSSSVRECAPYHDWVYSTESIPLKTIRVIKVTIVLENETFRHFSTSRIWWFLAFFNLAVLWRWSRLIYFKPFALKCRLLSLSCFESL